MNEDVNGRDKDSVNILKIKANENDNKWIRQLSGQWNNGINEWVTERVQWIE